jgi:hypothetical protein
MDARIAIEWNREPGKGYPVLEKLYRRSFGFWLNLVKISKLLKQSSAHLVGACGAVAFSIRDIRAICGQRPSFCTFPIGSTKVGTNSTSSPLLRLPFGENL